MKVATFGQCCTRTSRKLLVGVSALLTALLPIAALFPAKQAQAAVVQSTIVIQSSKNPSLTDDTITLTVVVKQTNGAVPTGYVTLRDGVRTLNPLGEAKSLTNGAAALQISKLNVGTHSITAQYTGDSNYSNGFSPVFIQQVQVNSLTTITSLSSVPNPSKYGDSIDFQVSVSPGQSTSDGQLSGTLSLYDGTSLLGTQTYQPGVNHFPFTFATVGMHYIKAVFQSSNSDFGDSTSNVLTQIVTADTTISLAAAPNPSNYGASVKFTAVVASKVQTTLIPSGSVDFKDGSTVLKSVALVNGMAVFSTSSLAAGTHSIVAAYDGTPVFLSSTSTGVTQTVNPVAAPTSTTLTSSPAGSTWGQSVTFTATVKASISTATGTVSFTEGANILGTGTLTTQNGVQVATFSTTALAAGPHFIIAVYGGNANFLGSQSGQLIQNVVPGQTSTTLTSSPNPSTADQSVTFTAKVKGSYGIPTGTVSFTEGSTILGTGTLVTQNGSQVATFNTSTLAAGRYTITASYSSGNANFLASTSGPLTQTVSSSGGAKVTPEVDLTANGSTSTTVSAGETVTFVARIHAAAGYPWPTGSITISDSANGNNRYGSANIVKDPNSNDGLATIANAAIAAGSYTLVATYGGDNDGQYYNGAQSNTISLTVKSLGASAPQHSIAISVTAGARNGTTLPVSLTVINNGTDPADSVTLSGLALRTLAGDGEAVLVSPSLPLLAGNLSPGASTVLKLDLQVPATIKKMALIENGTFLSADGSVYQFSPGQVLFP